MAGSLNGRASRLENGRVAPCKECGFDGDWSKVEIEVVWDDLDGTESAAGEVEEPKFCWACGHQLEYVVRWLDLSEPEEEA